MKVSIQSNPQFLQTDITFYKEENGKFAVMTEVSKGIPVMTEIPEGSYIDHPTLRLPEHLAHELFVALAEALDKKGIKTENDYKIAGTLEATKYHLEDMRKLALGGKK